MIDAIEIIISNGILNQYSALISYSNKVCYLNDKKYLVDDSFLNSIKDIISGWKQEYGTSNGIDIEEFTVTVYSNKKKYTYHGKGKFPNNYSQLKELLGGLNG